MGGEVIVISMSQEFTLDEHIRERFHNALMRAERHAPRIKGIDLVDMENLVETNLLESQLTIDDHLLGLLDLINYCKNGRSLVHITPENRGRHLSLANILTLNGIYLSNFLAKRNIDSSVILNYYAEKGKLSMLLKDNPLAVAISTTFISFDYVKEIARFVKDHNVEIPVIVGGTLIKKVMEKGYGLKRETLNWLKGFRGTHRPVYYREPGRTHLGQGDRCPQERKVNHRNRKHRLL